MEKYKDQICLRVLGRYVDCFNLLTAELCLEETNKQKKTCILASISLACALYLDGCIYLHRGTEYIRSERR